MKARENLKLCNPSVTFPIMRLLMFIYFLFEREPGRGGGERRGERERERVNE